MTFTEDRIPAAGIESVVAELERDLASRGLRCTVSWAPENAGQASVSVTCERDATRVWLLIAGIFGAVMFLLWPFVPGESVYGTLAWLGGAIAIGAYFLSLRKTSAGIAYDLTQQRLKVHRNASGDAHRVEAEETDVEV